MALLLVLVLVTADEGGWWRCLADVRSHTSSSSHVPVLIQSSRARAYLGGTAWACQRLEHDVARTEICQSCRWFDMHLPGSLSVSGELGHLDLKVPAQKCLDGSFPDSSDTGAWLRRDELVHLGRYAAVCVHPAIEHVRHSGWFSHSVYIVWIALTGACFLLLAPCCRRRRFVGSDGDVDPDFAPPPRPPQPPPWERYQEHLREPSQAAADSRASNSVGRVADTSAAPGSAAARIIRKIQQDLDANIDAPEAERKQVMRKYQMRWHPDKNVSEDKETATAVIQFLNSKKDWFLDSSGVPEAAPLLA